MENSLILRGKDITLRAVESDDIDFIYIAENDEQSWSVSATVAPFSRLLIQQYVELYRADIYSDRQLRLIVCNSEGERVGMADIYDFDPRNSRAGIGIYIVPTFRSKGLGTQALAALCRYAQDFLAIHNLYAIITEENVASRSIFGKCGFVEVAKLSDWIKSSNGYTGAVMLQRIV